MADPKHNSGAQNGCVDNIGSDADAIPYPYVEEDALAKLTDARFCFRTLNETRSLCHLISSQTFDPIIVSIGLLELMINAVEHGNLEITYEEKGALLKKGQWQKEVEHRLDLPKFQDRVAILDYSRRGNLITVVITDEGDGFEPEQYLQINHPKRKETVGGQYHGRGIAVASQLDFEKIEYLGKGNQVRVSILANNDLVSQDETDIAE